MGLILLLKDQDKFSRLEADFAEYYHIDVRDLWRPGSGLTYRRCINLVKQLRSPARTVQAEAKLGEYSLTDHILADVRDLLNMAVYLTVHTIQVEKRADLDKILKAAPKPMERLGLKDEEEKKEKKFASVRELQSMMGGTNKDGTASIGERRGKKTPTEGK